MSQENKPSSEKSAVESCAGSGLAPLWQQLAATLQSLSQHRNCLSSEDRKLCADLLKRIAEYLLEPPVPVRGEPRRSDVEQEAYRSCKALAERHGVPPEALRKRLSRRRPELLADGSCCEVEQSESQRFQYLYRETAAAMQQIDALKLSGST